VGGYFGRSADGVQKAWLGDLPGTPSLKPDHVFVGTKYIKSVALRSSCHKIFSNDRPAVRNRQARPWPARAEQGYHVGVKLLNPDSGTFAELRRAYLFADADDVQLARLSHSMQTVQLQHGEMLFHHDQPAERFFFLRAGQVKLFRVSPDGHEKIIEIIRPGQTFAEAVMFVGPHGRYPVSGEAISDCELFTFDQKNFLQVLSESHEIGFGMLASMSRRLHMLVNQIDGLTLQNATYRLVMYLLEQTPRDTAAATDVQLNTPKNAIASRLAIQPETFSRILGKLRDQGLVAVNGNQITLRNLKGLRELVYLPAAEQPRLC
jgi:CRP-like cAMP-binding protein